MKRHRNILLSGLLLLLVSFLWGGALTASAQETITNTAVITADNDTNPANNTASVTLGQCVAIANTATVSSSNEDSNSANNTSTVLVEDCNSTYAVNDINQTPVNVPVSGDVLTNDFDLEGDNQTVTGALVDRNGDGQLNEVLPIGMPTAIYGVDNQGNVVPAGTITLNANGTYTYIPALNFTGTVPVEYTITDDNTQPATDSATLTIKVVADTPANDPPVAQDDTASTEQGTPVDGNVLVNDSDPDGDPITLTQVKVDTDGDGEADDVIPLSTPTPVYGTDENGNIVPAGTLTVNPDGTWTFTPEPGFTGQVPVEYTIEDPGHLTDDATLTITVVPNAGNQTFANDDANVGSQGETLTGNILTNDFDPEGNDQDVTLIDSDGDGTPDTAPVAGTPITIEQNGSPIGTLTVDPETGAYIWVPVPGFVGTAVIPYQACDDGTPQACATATLYLTNLARPNSTYAINDINQTPVNVPVSGDVLTNDFDLEGDTQTVTGALADTDGDGLVDDVLPVGVATAVYGVDLTGAIVPAGTITLNGDGSYTYTPAPNFTGTVPVEYTITDDNATPATDSATLTIKVVADTPANDPPVAQDDTASTEQGTPVDGNVLVNDSDPDGDPITLTQVKVDLDGDGLADDPVTLGTPTPVYGTDENGNIVPAGTLTVNPDGTWTFTPEPGFTGQVPVEYTIEDPGHLTDDATLTITVVPNAGNQTFANDDANVGSQGETLTGNILTNDFDPEGNDQDVTLIDSDGDGTPDTAPVAGVPVTIKQNGSPIGTLTVDPETGAYIWVPVPGFVGTAVIPYTIKDDGSPMATATATLYLTHVPTPPTLVPDLTPIIMAVPNVMSGVTEYEIYVRAIEIKGANTSGTITLRIPKDPRWTMYNGWNGSFTQLPVSGIPVQNSLWTHTEDASAHIFTTTATVLGLSEATFGFEARWDAGQTHGSYTLSVAIVPGSGGEDRDDNNNDAERLDYGF